MSWAGGIFSLCRRKNSRTSLLMRLRTTALPMRRVTVKPKRGSPALPCLPAGKRKYLTTTKEGEYCLFPWRCTRRNSRLLSRRAALGNRCWMFLSNLLFDLLRSLLSFHYRLLSQYVHWFQSLTETHFVGMVTVKRFLPLARRRLSTFRPPGVLMRARNPWVRLRRMLLG